MVREIKQKTIVKKGIVVHLDDDEVRIITRALSSEDEKLRLFFLSKMTCDGCDSADADTCDKECYYEKSGGS